jgi:membrane-bound serine protease (ClpP class)
MMELFTSPNVAFMLMTLGLFGLIYEFVSPGAFLPGITGGICVLLAMFAINQMPVNYFGILLMILGIASMTAEAFFTRFRGALGIAGAVGFAVGGKMFIDSHLSAAVVSPWLIAGMTIVSLGVLSIGLKFILRTRKRSVSTGAEALRHSTGEIIHWSGGKGEVKAAGSIWKARSAKEYILKKGDKVKVADIDGLCLIIEPVN